MYQSKKDAIIANTTVLANAITIAARVLKGMNGNNKPKLDNVELNGPVIAQAVAEKIMAKLEKNNEYR